MIIQCSSIVTVRRVANCYFAAQPGWYHADYIMLEREHRRSFTSYEICRRKRTDEETRTADLESYYEFAVQSPKVRPRTDASLLLMLSKVLLCRRHPLLERHETLSEDC
jgi:hypothetical protein